MSQRDWSDETKKALRELAAQGEKTGVLPASAIDSALSRDEGIPVSMIEDFFRYLEERGIRIIEDDVERDAST